MRPRAIAVAAVLALLPVPARALERVPAVLLALSPKHASASAPISTFLAAADRAARRSTALAVRSAEQAGADDAVLDRCPPEERTTCWVRAVAGHAWSGPGVPPVRYLFVLAVQPESPGRDRVSLLAIDVLEAVALARAADTTAEGGRDRLEAALYEAAVRPPPRVVDSATPGALEGLFAELFAGPFAPLLARHGDAAPYGRIAVVSRRTNATLELDGRTAGALSAGTTVIDDVRPGRRTLAITVPGGPAVKLALEVESARTTTAAVDALLAAEEGPDPARIALLAGGAGALAAGTVLAILAGLQAGDVRSACVVRAGEDAGCARNAGSTLAHDAGAAPAFDGAAVDPPAPRTAPLAAALIGAGATWIAGALLAADDEGRAELWPIAAGLGAGAAIYGAGAYTAGRF